MQSKSFESLPKKVIYLKCFWSRAEVNIMVLMEDGDRENECYVAAIKE